MFVFVLVRAGRGAALGIFFFGGVRIQLDLSNWVQPLNQRSGRTPPSHRFRLSLG